MSAPALVLPAPAARRSADEGRPVRRALWLQAPTSPRTGRVGGRTLIGIGVHSAQSVVLTLLVLSLVLR